MTKKHNKCTPGHWQAVVGNGAGDYWNIHQKTKTIDGGYFCRVDALHVTKAARATARANAKLIEAAPSLLKLANMVNETRELRYLAMEKHFPLMRALAIAALEQAEQL